MERKGWDKITHQKEIQYRVYNPHTGEADTMSLSGAREALLSAYKDRRGDGMIREEIGKTALILPQELMAFNNNLKHALIESYKKEQLEKVVSKENLKKFQEMAESKGIDAKKGMDESLKNLREGNFTGDLNKDATALKELTSKSFGIDVSAEDIAKYGESEKYKKEIKTDIGGLGWLINLLLDMIGETSKSSKT